MKPLRLLLLTGLILMASAAQADVLLIESIAKEPPNSEAGLLRPTNGMSMDAVTARFGEPAEKIPAVGDPPITRWNYDKFTVYFEHNLVIHSTVNHP